MKSDRKDMYTIGIDPYEFPIQVRDNLPNGVFYMVNESGLVQEITLEWDDINKKNKVIVRKYETESKRIKSTD